MRMSIIYIYMYKCVYENVYLSVINTVSEKSVFKLFSLLNIVVSIEN